MSELREHAELVLQLGSDLGSAKQLTEDQKLLVFMGPLTPNFILDLCNRVVQTEKLADLIGKDEPVCSDCLQKVLRGEIKFPDEEEQSAAVH